MQYGDRARQGPPHGVLCGVSTPLEGVVAREGTMAAESLVSGLWRDLCARLLPAA